MTVNAPAPSRFNGHALPQQYEVLSLRVSELIYNYVITHARVYESFSEILFLFIIKLLRELHWQLTYVTEPQANSVRLLF